MKILRAVSALMIALGIAFIGIGMASAGDGGTQNKLDRAISGGGIVRLHIIADDDSAAAQAVKLRVRDAIIAAYGARLRALDDKDEALEFLSGELEKIELLSNAVLRVNGMDYSARAELGEYDFPDREYDGAVVPAGRYAALKIKLGKAEGKNWWCVIYPAMCVPLPDAAATARADAPEVEFYSAIWDWMSRAFG